METSVFRFCSALLVGVLAQTAVVRGQSGDTLGRLPEVAFSQLSDRAVSALGQKALAIRGNEWKHSETAHFVYHYFQSFVAGPVATESEFYYNVIAKDLERETKGWERKCHIFIFDKQEDWGQFKVAGALDPWTGGLCANGELFIIRDPRFKWQGNTLGHEVAHLVVFRFFGNGIPLWLNEGYAEYAASRGYAAFHRARGYLAKPKSQAVDPVRFIAVGSLTEMVSYPADELVVPVFYDESQRLVRFLAAADKRAFLAFFETMSKGARFDSALRQHFGSRYSSLDALEREFKTYATREHGTALQD